MKTPDALRELITYDPLCRQCREDAEKPNAGVTLLCTAHLVIENDTLRARLAASEQQATQWRDDWRVANAALADTQDKLAASEQARQQAEDRP